MTVGIKVQPDKQWMLTCERLRFPVDASVSPDVVPLVIMPDLRKSIEILEKHRGWHFIETMPARLPEGLKPCCDQIAFSKPGDTLKIRIKPSEFQGDTDDAHNFGTVSTPEEREIVDGKIDWVAILHFWQPGIWVNHDQETEAQRSLYTPANGFAPQDVVSNYRRKPKKAANKNLVLPNEMAPRSNKNDGNDRIH